MKYCSNCGSEIEEGDLFCTNCGTKQEQIISVEKKQTEQSAHQSATHLKAELPNNNSNLKNQGDFSSIGHIFLSMLIKPVTGAKQFVEKTEKNSVLVITIMLALIQGFLGIWKVSQVITSFQSMVMDIIKKVYSLMTLIQPSSTSSVSTNDFMTLTTEINKVKALLNIPYGKIFIQNIFLFLISLGILFVVVYLIINILSNNKSDAFLIYKAVLIVTVPTLYFEGLSILVSYASFYAGYGIALIGLIISLGTLAIVIKEKLNVNENYSIFAVAIVAIVILIGVVICLQKFLTSDISDIVMSVSNIMKTLN